MKRQERWRRGLIEGLFLAALVGAGGCFHLHGIPPAGPECVEPCQLLPPAAKSHVHIFLIHGLDPLDCANLKGVRDYVQGLGFLKTHYGQFFHTAQFEREIRCIHKEDPNAHFVLIGFSCGANKVRTLAQAVTNDGITIDLVVYLDGPTLKSESHERPENVCRIINIVAEGRRGKGVDVEGAENVQVAKAGHFGSPTHPYTVETLARELAAIAATVPVIMPAAPAQPPEEAPPTPRPLSIQPEGPQDEWDFLKPVPQLGNRMPPAQP